MRLNAQVPQHRGRGLNSEVEVFKEGEGSEGNGDSEGELQFTLRQACFSSDTAPDPVIDEASGEYQRKEADVPGSVEDVTGEKEEEVLPAEIRDSPIEEIDDQEEQEEVA